MDIFKERLPDKDDIFVVLGVILFAVFSWSIRGFFFILPSILLRYAVVEIIAIFSYMMAVALVESFLVIICLVFISVVLPRTWLREGFSYKGFLVVLITSIVAILYQASIKLEFPETKIFIIWFGVLAFLLIGMILFFHYIPRFRTILVTGVKSFTVFAYLYIPLGVLGLAVVIFRNFFKG